MQCHEYVHCANRRFRNHRNSLKFVNMFFMLEHLESHPLKPYCVLSGDSSRLTSMATSIIVIKIPVLYTLQCITCFFVKVVPNWGVTTSTKINVRILI